MKEEEEKGGGGEWISFLVTSLKQTLFFESIMLMSGILQYQHFLDLPPVLVSLVSPCYLVGMLPDMSLIYILNMTNVAKMMGTIALLFYRHTGTHYASGSKKIRWCSLWLKCNVFDLFCCECN